MATLALHPVQLRGRWPEPLGNVKFIGFVIDVKFNGFVIDLNKMLSPFVLQFLHLSPGLPCISILFGFEIISMLEDPPLKCKYCWAEVITENQN